MAETSRRKRWGRKRRGRKRRKAKENDGEDTETDRISSLPDSVLLHILSFLSLKTCVRTISLVSRRYRHLWEHLQVLNFYDDYLNLADGESERFRHFAIFVNAVLARLRSRDILKMRLSCVHSGYDGDFSKPSIDTWIRTAIGPHLEELHIALFPIDDQCSLLPHTLFTCPNLVSLSLYGYIMLPLPSHSLGICLPSLTSLKMLQMDIDQANATYLDAILSGCLILETLELSFFDLAPYRILAMPHSLKRLKFTIKNHLGAYLQIDAPGLKYLSLTNVRFGDDVVGNLHNVVEAHLDVFPPPGESVPVDPLLNLLRALTGVKHLVLRCSTTKWLFGGPTIVYHYPEFHHLLHLELILPCFNMSFLFHMLQKCPMLQALIIQNDKDQSPNPYGFAAQPESVPNCLVSHLTFIHFKGYEGSINDQEFARYVLQKGLVLKMVRISGLSLDLKEMWEKYRILNRFSDTPRGSAICQIKFD